MNKNFTQPTNATAKEVNRQSIARDFGVSKSLVGVLNTSTALDSYSLLFDTTTQTVWFRASATGTPTKWSLSGDTLSITTENDTYTLYPAISTYVGDYSSSELTLTTGEFLSYLGKKYTLKSSVTSFTTTGTSSTTWANDKANFVSLSNADIFNMLTAYGDSLGTQLITANEAGDSLADIIEKLPFYAGNYLPTYSDWSAGSTSVYATVWRWTDGTFWWGCNGTLPDEPSLYSMRRYDPFGDAKNIQKILANIFFNDRTTGSTLWSIFLSGVTNRIPISSNTTMFSGSGTMDSVLSIAPMLQLIGALTWPDYSLTGAPQLTTLSSTAASTYGTYANYWALSTPSALGVSTDTGVCSVWTGVTRAKRLYRLVITTTGHIFIRVMSADLTWGSSYEVYSTLNTTKSSAGVLSAASPIVRIVDTVSTSERTDLMEDTFEQAGDYGVANDEATGCVVTKLATGTYKITGCSSLAVEGWQVKDPFPLQGSTALGLAEGINNDDGSVTVYLYKRKLVLNSDTMEITETKGDLLDVPAESWIDVRLTMPTTEEESA